METKTLKSALHHLFLGVAELKQVFASSGRRFTLDGRLVGDIGEALAGLEYEVELDSTSVAIHDATGPDGRRIQIKATFQQSLTFRTTPDYYLGLQLFPDGSWQEVFNGPGTIIAEHYAHRKGLGQKLLSFPISQLAELSRQVPIAQRIPRRELL